MLLYCDQNVGLCLRFGVCFCLLLWLHVGSGLLLVVYFVWCLVYVALRAFGFSLCCIVVLFVLGFVWVELGFSVFVFLGFDFV